MNVAVSTGGRWLVQALVTIAVAGVGQVVAQSTGTPPAPAVTSAELARYLDVLAADSLHGPTPGPGLDRTVRYLIGEWHALGLRPGLPGQRDTAWVQRYPLPGQLTVDYTTAGLTIESTPHSDTVAIVREEGYSPWHPRGTFTFATDARFLSPIMPAPWTRLGGAYKSTVLVAGPQTVASVRTAPVAGCIVLYVPPAHADSAAMQAVLQPLIERSAGVVVLSPADSTHFAAQVRAGASRPAVFADEYLPRAEERSWLAELRAESLRATLDLHGVDLTTAQTTRTPLVQSLPFLLVRLLRELPDERTNTGVMAPNVVATLPGSDPTLQQQWIVVTASIDRTGPNGAPNTLGVAGLLALARALAVPDARPRRPVVFVATTGSHADFAGSHAFVTWAREQAGSMLAVTLDLTGPPSRDSVAIDGLRELALKPATSPTVVAALHPELGLTLVDTGSVLLPTADGVVFGNHWVPTLGFRNVGSPAPSATAAGAGARLLSLAGYVIEALANAEAADLPQWNEAAKLVLMARPLP